MDDSLLDATETDSVKKIEKSSKTEHDDGKSADRELPQLGEKRSSSTPSESTKADPDKRKKRPRRGRRGRKVVYVSEVNK